MYAVTEMKGEAFVINQQTGIFCAHQVHFDATIGFIVKSLMRKGPRFELCAKFPLHSLKQVEVEFSGYTSSITLSEASKDNVLLAHGFFDQELPLAHGAPLRALIPDRYFYKSVKWLQQIKFTVEDEPGYYESNGYSNSADPWKEERFEEERTF